MTNKYVLIATTLLLIGAGCYAVPAVTPTPTPTPAPTARTYHNATLKFAVDYPDRVLVFEDKAKMAASGYIPACDPETAVACFVIPQSAYAGKNFDSAGLAVNVLAAAKTSKACLTPEGNMKATEKVTVNGIEFSAFTDGDAAMSHYSSGMDYRAFKNGKCFNLTTRVNTTAFEVYEPGQIKNFTDADLTAVTKTLDGMFQSFRFE